MSFKLQSVFTKTFTDESFVLTQDMGLTILSINLLSGVATILGTTNAGSNTPTAVSMTVGQPVLISADSGFTLTGVTIDSTAGGVFEVLGK